MKLHEKIDEFYRAKKRGGFIDKTKIKVKDYFPVFNGISRKVVIKLNSDITEDTSLFNINFKPKELKMISGEIADHILRHFGEYFTVVAVSNLKDHNGRVGFYEVVFNETKNEYVPKKKGSESVLFDKSKLNLLSDSEVQAERERLELEKEAERVAHIAKVNAKAKELAGIKGSNKSN